MPHRGTSEVRLVSGGLYRCREEIEGWTIHKQARGLQTASITESWPTNLETLRANADCRAREGRYLT